MAAVMVQGLLTPTLLTSEDNKEFTIVLFPVPVPPIAHHIGGSSRAI